MVEKVDPVGDEFYKPLLRADRAADWLFYISASLSVAALWIQRAAHPPAYQIVQVSFALSVVALFSVGLAIRLYFFPRAQQRRYQDFLAHAFDQALSHKQTVAYYNNSSAPGAPRVAAQVLESSFFTKDILARMIATERVKVVLYAAIWLFMVLYRETDLALIGVAAQILFSEQILSRWLRLEWFRWQSERVYDDVFRLLQSKADLTVTAWGALGRYEIVKATSCISLSASIFEREVQRLNREWDEVRRTLSI
jgi:hypothetical protein